MDEHSGDFHMLAIGNDATVDIGEHICRRISAFVFFRRIPRSEIAGSYGSSILIFEAPLYFSPQHSHQFTIPPEYTRAPFSPYPCQCFLFVVLMITILIVVGWYIIVVLMCLSLMINDVEHLLTFVSLFNIKRCCIKISCYDDGFISLLFLQAKYLQVYNNYNLCMNWLFNLGTHCIPNKHFLS